jgi:two-component system, OmpR family, phosphate regulon sensor histidine kinase PhoR
MGNIAEDSNMPPEDKQDFQDVSFYRFVIDSLPTAVLTVNADRAIIGFNPWAEKITGYSKSEALGKYCGKILQGGMCRADCPLKTAMKGNIPVSLIETTIVNKMGETVPVRINTAALFDDNAHLIGGVESFHDISHLKSLEREKGNLISMFAHDMKSSLTIIGGFVIRLLKKSRQIDAEKQNRYLSIIKTESGKLESLINEFLEFSRLQTGRLKLNLSAISLDKELMELSDVYQLKASESGINLVLENEEALPIIIADTGQLRRVFTNLLDNAIKFSKGKGTITISAHETSEAVIVQVKDEGVGIEQDELPYIFDSFHRGRDTEKKEGFGLGLASAKVIVEGHGGRILVKSEPGKGSAFTVVLPKAHTSVK